MSLQVWLPLTKNLNNCGLSNLQFSYVDNSITSLTSGGKVGEKCLHQNALSKGGIVSNSTINLGNQISMFCWIKFTTVNSSSNLSAIGGQHRYPNFTGMGITLKYVNSTSAYLSVNTGNGTTRTYNNYCGKTLLTANNWYHVGFTYDENTIRLYVNGQLDGTHNFTGQKNIEDYIGIHMWSFSNTSITQAIHDGYRVIGDINDFKIYDHCLSIQEIERDYSSLLIHYPLRDSYVENTENLLDDGKFSSFSKLTLAVSGYTTTNGISTLTTGTHTATTGSIRTLIPLAKLANNTAYTLTFKWRLKSGQGSLKVGDWCDNPNVIHKKEYFNGSYWEMEVYLPARATYDSTYRFIDFNAVGAESIYEIWDVQLEAKDHSTAFTISNRSNEPVYDCSGRGHDSVDRGNLIVSADSGRNNYCTTFSINNSIKFPSPYGATTTQLTDFSIAMWLKLADNSGNYKTIFSTWFGNNASGTMGWLGVNTENKDLWFYNGKYHGVGSGSYPLNEWHHIVMTYKNGAAQWYLDGEAYGSPISDTIGYVNAYKFFGLGDSYTGSNWGGANFTGSISDFRFYGTAIPATIVKDLYKNSATIDNQGNIHAFEYVEV